MQSEDTRAEKARAMRWKRPALQSMGFEHIQQELEEIVTACDEITYAFGDNYDLMYSMLGEDDEAEEFRMLFPDISADAERMDDLLREACEEWNRYDLDYDDCTVALIGDCYETVGYDDYETDYYALTAWQADVARTKAGERLMRLTKKDMLNTIAVSVRVLVAFLDLRQRYDYLKASFDILRGENAAHISTVKEIDDVYEDAAAVEFDPYKDATKRFDKLLSLLPKRVFVE